MRAFVAVDLPAEFEDEVAALARSLHACVEGRFLKRQTYHVTLAFLGEINEADARRAIDALERACALSAPVLLEPKGFERFGHRREGLLALALEADPGLVGLAENLRSGLRAQGVAYDEKSYTAIVPPAYVEQYPFSESESSMPWLVAKFQKVMNSEPDGEAPMMEVRMWADDYQLSFGGTSSNVGTVSEDGKVLTTNKANSSLMFEVKKDLGVLDPKKVTWFRIRIDFEDRAYFAETYVTPYSI